MILDALALGFGVGMIGASIGMIGARRANAGTAFTLALGTAVFLLGVMFS